MPEPEFLDPLVKPREAGPTSSSRCGRPGILRAEYSSCTSARTVGEPVRRGEMPRG